MILTDYEFYYFDFQTFLLDHAVIRRKFGDLKERCCPSFKFQYSAIEEEIVTTPDWPPIGPEGIVTSPSFSPDAYAPDDFAKETDRMLPDSVDYNRSSLSSTPTVGNTPKTSTSENPYLSSTTIDSSQKASVVSSHGYSYHSNSPPQSSSLQNSKELITPEEVVNETQENVGQEKVVPNVAANSDNQNSFGLHDKSPCPV